MKLLVRTPPSLVIFRLVTEQYYQWTTQPLPWHQRVTATKVRITIQSVPHGSSDLNTNQSELTLPNVVWLHENSLVIHQNSPAHCF